MYKYLSNGSFNDSVVPESPDPLVGFRWNHPQASDDLQIYHLSPKSVSADVPSSFSNLDSLTTENPYVTVDGSGVIFLDFGVNSPAWIEFNSPDLSGCVEVGISEHEVHEVKKGIPIKYGNTYRYEPNSELYEGVRYVWIDVKSSSDPWHITGIRLVCQAKPTNYNGSFSCSDPELTKIWYTGAYTVRACYQKDYMGSILVDRGDRTSFTGDAHVIQAASLAAFGNYDFIKKNLDRTANDSNGILSYSLYWILSVVDYYKYTGDNTAIGNYIINATTILEDAYKIYNTDFNQVWFGWDQRLGAGFEFPNSTETRNGYRMLAIRAWREFAWMMDSCGRFDLRDRYTGYAEDKISELRQNSQWFDSFGMYADAYAVNSGFTNQTEQNSIFSNYFTDRVNRIFLSPFHQYFIIQAMARMNKYEDTLSSIRDCWGGQLNDGATTFYELYRPSYNTENPHASILGCSLCHPWSSGVTIWLTEETLGIKPTSPGFTNYDVLPHLGNTLTNVSGNVPTPKGTISASFDVSSGACSLTAPSGTTGRMGIPKVGRTINDIYINGNLAWSGTYHHVPDIDGANEDEDFVYFTSIQPGTYNISVSYTAVTAATAIYAPPLEAYVGSLIKADKTTGGNWGGVYGKEGYVLFNYNGSGNDVSALPPYVNSVYFRNPYEMQYIVSGSGINEQRALAPDRNNSFPRNGTSIELKSPDYHSYWLIVDISEIKKYRVALYMVDWNEKGLVNPVEMYDGNTLNLVAPIKFVRNFQNGCYLIFEYDKSCIFRVYRGTLSGIFFDS